jgi:anti-sigma factor RsiW
MSHSCAEWRGDIGAYIVGALDGPARARVRRHLAACAGCRADYDELVPVRAWLDQLASVGRWPETGRAWQPEWPPHALRPEDPLPEARSDRARVPDRRREPAPRPAAQPTWRLRGIRLRTRQRLLATGVALATAAAFLAVLVTSGPLATSFRAVDRTTGVSGRAQLHGTAAGTEIDLTATGLPGGEHCILVAVARDDADIAGTWNATYDGSARTAGMSAFPASQLTALRIESDSGRLLLSIRV